MVDLFLVLLGACGLTVLWWLVALVLEARQPGSEAARRRCTRAQALCFVALLATALLLLLLTGGSKVGFLSLITLPVCAVMLWATRHLARYRV